MLALLSIAGNRLIIGPFESYIYVWIALAFIGVGFERYRTHCFISRATLEIFLSEVFPFD